jgi:hypothetical protein
LQQSTTHVTVWVIPVVRVGDQIGGGEVGPVKGIALVTKLGSSRGSRITAIDLWVR